MTDNTDDDVKIMLNKNEKSLVISLFVAVVFLCAPSFAQFSLQKNLDVCLDIHRCKLTTK